MICSTLSTKKMTDKLHEVCGFRTDYEFITKSQMKTIQKKVKVENQLPYLKTKQKTATLFHKIWNRTAIPITFCEIRCH